MTGRMLALSCAVAILGCGHSKKPVDVLRDYLDAVQAGEFATACELLSDGARRTMEIEGTCEENVMDVRVLPETARQISDGDFETERDGDRVSIRPANGLGGYDLRLEDGEWRVDTTS